MADETYIDSKYTRKTPEDLPEWFDEDLFKIGQQYFCKNALGLVSCYLAGLISVFLIPQISKILMFTKQSSTACSAYKRYFQTTLHIYHMHIGDVLDPESKFYKSINVILWKHWSANNRALQTINAGITQREMVLTQFGFIGYVLTHAKETSLTNDTKERQGINHFWRVIGHLLDIPDRLNLCRKDEYETTLLCQKLIDDVYAKNLEEPSANFLHLTEVSIKGLQCLDPMTNLDGFLTFFYELNNRKYEKKVSLYSRWNIFYRKSLFYLIRMPIIGSVVRTWWNWYLPAIYWIYQRYPFIAWLKYGSNVPRLQMYPHELGCIISTKFQSKKFD